MIIKRQLEFLGHIMWKNGYEELVLAGSVDGKRSREDRGEVPYKPEQMVPKQLPRKEKDKAREINLLRTCKRQKYVEIHDHAHRCSICSTSISKVCHFNDIP